MASKKMTASDLCVAIMLGWLKAHDEKTHGPLEEHMANEMTMKTFLEADKLTRYAYNIGIDFNDSCLELFSRPIDEEEEDDEAPWKQFENN